MNLLRVTQVDLFGKNIEYSAAVPVFEDALENFIALLKTGIAGREWHGTLLLDKGDRFLSCHVTPVVFNDGRKGVSVRLEELTELRHREIALQESEARLRSIIRAAPVGIGVVSNRVILEVNERLCQMTGYQAGELIGKPARIFYKREEEYGAVGREQYELIDQTGVGTVQTQWQKKKTGPLSISCSVLHLSIRQISPMVSPSPPSIPPNAHALRRSCANVKSGAANLLNCLRMRLSFTVTE
ncbi:MAG: PAS domain-containing protein [Methanoregula sp.]